MGMTDSIMPWENKSNETTVNVSSKDRNIIINETQPASENITYGKGKPHRVTITGDIKIDPNK